MYCRFSVSSCVCLWLLPKKDCLLAYRRYDLPKVISMGKTTSKQFLEWKERKTSAEVINCLILMQNKVWTTFCWKRILLKSVVDLFQGGTRCGSKLPIVLERNNHPLEPQVFLPKCFGQVKDWIFVEKSFPLSGFCTHSDHQWLRQVLFDTIAQKEVQL